MYLICICLSCRVSSIIYRTIQASKAIALPFGNKAGSHLKFFTTHPINKFRHKELSKISLCRLWPSSTRSLVQWILSQFVTVDETSNRAIRSWWWWSYVGAVLYCTAGLTGIPRPYGSVGPPLRAPGSRRSVAAAWATGTVCRNGRPRFQMERLVFMPNVLAYNEASRPAVHTQEKDNGSSSVKLSLCNKDSNNMKQAIGKPLPDHGKSISSCCHITFTQKYFAMKTPVMTDFQ